MSDTVGQIALELGIDSSQIVNQLTGASNKAAKQATSIFSGFGKKIAAGLSIAAVTKFTKDCIEVGSNVTEVQNVVDTAFKDLSWQADQWASNAMTNFGLSELSAKKYMGVFGQMSNAMGITGKAALDMAENVTGLTGDVASFYNLSTDEAYTKLKSIWTGETETLKDLGVIMTQTNLDQYALNNGFGKTTAKMTEQEKVMLRYQYVTSALSNATGDFVKTQDSWANQTRILTLRFQQLKASLGKGFIALFTPILRGFNSLLAGLQKVADGFASFVQMLTGADISSSMGSISADIAGIGDDAGGAADNVSGIGDAIVITIGAFAAVWKAVDLAEFLMNAGGVVGIINKMKAAIHACTLAKIADKFETVQLCAMYAKDFVKSIIQSISKLEIYYTTWFKVNILQSDTVKGIKDLVTNIKASTIALKDDIVEWVRNTAEKTKNKAVDIGGNIKNLAIDMAKATKELALQSIEWVKNTAEKAKNKAVDVTTGIKDFIVNMALATKELVSQAIQWGISTASKVADTAATAAHTAATWLATAATTAFGVSMSVLTSPITLVIVALAALGVAIYELVKHWDVVKDAAGKCWDWITDKWCKAGDWFKGIWQNIKSAFSSFDNWLQNIFNIDFSDSFGFIGDIMNAYLQNVSNIFGDVKQIFGGLIDFITGVFSGDWSEAWNGIVDAFGGIFSLIADIAKGPINMVIGLINGMLDGLESGINWIVRKVNGLSFDVPDWVPVIGGDHFGFDLPEVGFGSIPYLAQGGYVKPNTPQLAMIGDNKHQGEVVAPEDKLIDMAQKAAAMASSAELLAEAISILKQILKVLETLDLDIQLDGKSLKKYVVDKINEHTKQTGKCEIIH